MIDFHHVDPKGSDSKVNDLVAAGRFSAAMKEAEERCIPLCANCHRIYHWEQFNTIEE